MRVQPGQLHCGLLRLGEPIGAVERFACGIVLIAVLSTLTLVAAVAAETGSHGAPFCFVLADLRTYIDGMRAHDAAQLDRMEDAGICVFLKPGVRIEVTRTFADFGPGTVHPVGVRVFGNGASTDGFSVSEMLADTAVGPTR